MRLTQRRHHFAPPPAGHERAVSPGPHSTCYCLSFPFQLSWRWEAVWICISLVTDVVWVWVSLSLSSFRSLLGFLDI